MSAPSLASGRWPEEFLESMRLVKDPEADEMAATVFNSGGHHALIHMTRALEVWEDPIPDSLPENMRDFFARPVEYPDFFDPEKIKIAEDLFVSYGPVSVVVLLMNAVPHFFTNPAGARSFYLAKIFNPKSLRNRMLQVPQFVVDITERGGLAQTPDPQSPYGIRKGRGIITVQKLRVIHAGIRILLKLPQRNPEDNWDLKTLGEPISQCEMAEAVMCFCVCTIDGLKKAGLIQSPEQQEATLNAWKSVGFLLGLQNELQPDNIEEAYALRDAIYNRTAKSTREASVLIREMLHIMKSIVPILFRQFPAGTMRYQLGKEVADLLDVPNPRFLMLIMTMLKPFWENEKGFAKIAKTLSPHLVRWLQEADKIDDRFHLRLPAALALKWGAHR